MREEAHGRTGPGEARFAHASGEQPFGPDLEHFTDGFFTCDADWRVVAVNAAAERVLGLRREELIGRDHTEVFPDALRTCVVEGCHRLEDGQPHACEQFHAPSGRWLQQRCFPRRGGGMFCYFLDITDRKRAEEALGASEERYRSLVETTSDLIWEVDAEGRYTFLSRKCEEMCGYPAERLLGRTPLDLLPDDCADELRRRVEAVIVDRQPFSALEVPLHHPDGRQRIIEGSGVPIFAADGRFQGLRGISRDVTERKRVEAERQRLQHQLLHSQKMESIGRLAGGVAHDFNNMLSVILGYAEIALDKVPADSSLHADLTEIANAATRSAEITRQVLAFARREAVNPQVLDLNRSVDATLKMLGRLIGEDIDLVWQPGQQVWPVRMDPSQLDQILANLCVNARDAITGPGRITIATESIGLDRPYPAIRSDCPPGNFVLLSVTDNGSGMDEATRDRLFEPFYTTKGTGAGTGLGLATVFAIVRQNNGCIDVDTAPGEGTTVRIFLPRHQGERETVPADIPIGPPRGDRETVLVVDDEPSILKLAARMLGELGYRVLTASLPGEAVELARQHGANIDVLLTDVVMPEMNGHDLIARLRALSPDLGLVYMSGYAPHLLDHLIVLDNGSPFLRKPFSSKDLAVKIRQALTDR